MGVRSFTAVVHREGEEYLAICPEMGTAARGATSTDAVERLRLATGSAAREYPAQGRRRLLARLRHPAPGRHPRRHGHGDEREPCSAPVRSAGQAAGLGRSGRSRRR